MGKIFSGAAKAVTGAVKGIVQPVYNATLKQIPGVDKAFVGLDKAVGKTIPGGWGTVAAIGASFIPGSQLALMGMTSQGLATGLGALSGSGVMRGNNEFNLQGAIMGGAMAYGASELSQGFQNAGAELAAAPTGATSDAIAKSASNAGGDVIGNFNSSMAFTGPDAALANTPAFDPSSATNFSYTPSGEMVPSNISPNITGATPFTPPVPTPTGLETLTTAGKETLSNMGTAAKGLGNLTGFGADGSAAAARAALSKMSMTALGSGVMGLSGIAALEEQQKALDEQKAAGAVGQAEYAAAKAKIDEQVAYANSVVGANPLQSGTDLDSIQADQRDFALTRKTDNVNEDFYLADGGMLLPDDETGIVNGSPLRNFERGGMYGLAAGGMLPPRFLSGGGDGMSDSIKANINGRQEARLADGEFVIPADVVSHLGNGSSKAGAKQLYSMMDKVRQARVGTKKQGKQINPRKYLAA